MKFKLGRVLTFALALALGAAPVEAQYNPALIPQVPTIAFLRTMNVTAIQYNAASVTAVGKYTWVASSVASDDGYTTILPTGHSGSGRWVLDSSFLQERYGRSNTGSLPNLNKALAEYDISGKPTLYVVGFGSSIGLLTDLNGNTPGKNVFNAIQTAVNKGSSSNYTMAYDEESVGGSIALNFPTAWATMLGKGHVPTVCVFTYGENDFQTSQYNAGETWLGGGAGGNNFQTYMRNAAKTCWDNGADVVIITSQHYGIMNSGNTPTQPSMPTAIPQIYPSAVAAPVSCSNLVPTCSNGLITGDLAGLGQTLYQDWRFAQGNNFFRLLAAQYNAPLIDAEFSSWWTLSQYMLGNGATQAAAEYYYYGSYGSLHPNATGMSTFYSDPIAQWGKNLQYQLSADSAGGAMLYGLPGSVFSGSPRCATAVNVGATTTITIPNSTSGFINFYGRMNSYGAAGSMIYYAKSEGYLSATRGNINIAPIPTRTNDPVSSIATGTGNIVVTWAITSSNEYFYCVYGHTNSG